MFDRRYAPSDTHPITSNLPEHEDRWIWSSHDDISNKNDERQHQQQKHKPLASPTLASKAANHKSMKTAESEARTMTSPTKTTTTPTTKTQASSKSNTGKQSSKP